MPGASCMVNDHATCSLHNKVYLHMPGASCLVNDHVTWSLKDDVYLTLATWEWIPLAVSPTSTRVKPQFYVTFAGRNKCCGEKWSKSCALWQWLVFPHYIAVLMCRGISIPQWFHYSAWSHGSGKSYQSPSGGREWDFYEILIIPALMLFCGRVRAKITYNNETRCAFFKTLN